MDECVKPYTFSCVAVNTAITNFYKDVEEAGREYDAVRQEEDDFKKLKSTEEELRS